MFAMIPSWKHMLRPRSSFGRSFSGKPRPAIPAETRVEEETFSFYESEAYHPTNIGDVFKSRYQIVGKLGYGASSVVWLTRDLRERKYLSLKISTHGFPDETCREVKIYEHLSKLDSTHPGQSLIRELYDTFELESPFGRHQCLLQPAMHMSLLEMMDLNSKPFDLALLKLTLTRILTALDFLHTEAELTHTDLKADNIMLTIEDETMLTRFEEAEIAQPSPRKVNDNSSTVYKSRSFPKPMHSKYGLPVLCDFGEVRIGKIQNSGPHVQPTIYRAPEVIFEMPWGSAIDIWNLACLTWDLFQGEHLFRHVFDKEGNHNPFQHLAQIVSLIGPPPKEYVKRSETAEQCFDTEGNWTAQQHAEVPSGTFEDRETRLIGQEKKDFLRFLRSMLRWLPEERKTAKELLQDPWLQER